MRLGVYALQIDGTERSLCTHTDGLNNSPIPLMCYSKYSVGRVNPTVFQMPLWVHKYVLVHTQFDGFCLMDIHLLYWASTCQMSVFEKSGVSRTVGMCWELVNREWKVWMPVRLLQSLSVAERGVSFQDRRFLAIGTSREDDLCNDVSQDGIIVCHSSSTLYMMS